MGNQTSTPNLQDVNSKDLTRNIETLLRNAHNNDSVDNETLGFRRSSFDSSSLSDLHIQTIQEKLMRGGFFDNEPRRQRYLNLGQQLNVNGTTKQVPSARVNTQANNIFVKKTVEQASGVESADTDALFDKLNQYINNQAGGNIESAALDSVDLDTIASENMVAKIEGMLRGNRQLGQNGGAKNDDDEDSFSFNTETINEILRKRLNNAPTQAGGVIEKINSEVDSLNSENIESLKNIILEQLSKKEGEEMKGGYLSPTNEGIINLDSDPNLREIENAVKVKNGGNDLFDSISENDLKQLRDMILSKEQAGGSNQVYSATSSTPISYSKLGLVGGGDDGDDGDDDEEEDDDDTSLDNSEEDTEKKTEDDSDASLDDELTDDESEEEEEESEEDEDEGETSEMARNKREESSSSSSASNSSESSSELQSSDLRRLHRYMNSDAYVVASNSSESKDYKINVQDFYTTDSNTYKGNDSGSEYFKTMRNRDRSH